MTLQEIGKQAAVAKYGAALMDTDRKNEILLRIADRLLEETDMILEKNALDVKRGQENGMPSNMQDRLKLTPERISAMAEGVRQVAQLPDPVGEVLEEFDRPNGMHIKKVSVPLGVVGIIFESRPNVTIDAFSLCFKAGNAVILKGGSDAVSSNAAIVECVRNVLCQEGEDPDILQLITDTDRAVTTQFMKLKEYVDVLIPRGGAGLIRAVVENATIPVIETGTGNCHVYVDEAADLDMAVRIIVNAKTQRNSVCNACESLVVHEAVSGTILPMLQEALGQKHVEIRADERASAFLTDMVPATEVDFATEYLGDIISIKTVGSVDEAIAHINRYNTGHSETIVTQNRETAELFLKGVDAACVYHNVSTRFTDGFEFGFGAEIGISTQKLHARGPMGLRELNSYKYTIEGDGQIRE